MFFWISLYFRLVFALLVTCLTLTLDLLFVKDALVLSIDRKGLSLLGKVLGPMMDDGSHEYQWKELRLLFSEEARDVETFCKRLVEMEKDALKNISGFSGLPLYENQI